MQVLGRLRVFKVVCVAVLGLCLVVGIGSQGASAVAAGAAGTLRSGAVLAEGALTGVKALVPGSTYAPGECSAASGLQAEAIAHARAVAWLNRHNPYGVPAVNGITPAFQWETYVGATPTLRGLKPDIMVQSPTHADDQVGLLEVNRLDRRLAAHRERPVVIQREAQQRRPSTRQTCFGVIKAGLHAQRAHKRLT